MRFVSFIIGREIFLKVPVNIFDGQEIFFRDINSILHINQKLSIKQKCHKTGCKLQVYGALRRD